MITPGMPENEAERLLKLQSYDVLDTPSEPAIDDLTELAAQICGTPVALVSLVDQNRQWFKSRVGIDATETPREVAFCAHAILDPDNVLLVEDSHADERFHDNPLATGDANVRFYAGTPLVTTDGYALGTLCVIDGIPRDLSPDQVEALRALGRQVVSQLELRRAGCDLRDAARELKRSNRELREFTSVAAHDLREPLRKITSFGSLLVRDLGDDLPESAAEDLRQITDGARRMSRLIEDLLQLSRAGSSRLQLEPVALGSCVDAALEALSLTIAERGASVTVDPLPDAVADATLLTQAFQNLVANALKFCEAQPPAVRVTCERRGEETVLGVLDNGIGIEPQYAEQIFQPFQRLHARGRYEGSGIGLSIVRKAVERHEGRIWIEPAPGGGSHFRFTLPLAFRSVPAEAPQTTSPERAPA